MSTNEEPPLSEPGLEYVNEARIFAQNPSNNWVGLSVDANDNVQVVTNLGDILQSVANDEARVRLFAQDDGGNLAEIQAEELGTALGGTETAIVTYLSQALQGVGNDEVRSRLHDSTGTQIDPLNQDALQSVANDEVRSRIHDSAGTQIDPARSSTHDTEYTSIDLNTAATTTIYDPTTEAEVGGVHLAHGGSTAELRLEITDGTNTAVLQDAAAGNPINYPDPLHLNSDDSLQVVVETVEGAALTETAAVSREEY